MKQTEQERIDEHLRRSRRAGLPAALTLTEWEQTIADFNGLCAYCQQRSFDVLEHFLPAEIAGTHTGNCVPACRLCNTRKSGHTGSIVVAIFGQATIDRIQAYLTVRATNKALQIFSYEGNEVRTITDEHGETWWVAADVCKVLDIDNVADAVSRLDDDEKNTIVLTDGNRGNPNRAIVNEPGLYTLILGSRKSEAKAFKRWVTHEVIPAIRKTGSYTLKQERQATQQEVPLQGYDDLQAIVADKEKRRQLIKALQKIDRGHQDLEDMFHPQPPALPAFKERPEKLALEQTAMYIREHKRYHAHNNISKVSKEIIDILDQAGRPLYPKEIATQLRTPEGTIRKRLFDMKARGEVKDTGQGYISLVK